MVRDRAGRTACHRLLERPQASVCLGAQTAPSRATSFRYCGNTKCNTYLADAPLSADKDYLVVSRLKPQLTTWNVATLDSLVERLRTQPKGNLADQVIAALTINETLWFRDQKPFDALKNVIIPELVPRSPLDRPIAIWSAACSTGQEVYSIAMVMREEEQQLRGRKVTLLGSDICEPVLARARKGIYSQFEVQRGMPVQRLVK